MTEGKDQHQVPGKLLTQEQEQLLDLYLQKLDNLYEELKASEKLQVEIETEHLKRILTK